MRHFSRLSVFLLVPLLLVACAASSTNYPIITPNFDLEARARELIETPLPVLAPMLEVRVRESLVQYQGFKTDKVDVYNRVEADIDLHQLCLPDGKIGETQDYVFDNIQFALSGEAIPESAMGASLTIDNVSGGDYREQRCDSQERLIITMTAFVKFGAGLHLGEIDLRLRDGSTLHYEFGLEVSSGVSFG